MSVQEDNTLPTVITEDQKKMIQGALKEMSNSMTRVEAEKELQKEIADRMKEECMIPKRDFNKLAKIYHASNLVEEAQRNEEFMEFAEAVISPIGLEQKI